MKKITRITGATVPLKQAHIDTDIIMPKQYLKSITKTGFGRYVFDAWRFKDEGYPGLEPEARQVRSDFVLNQAQYKNATILLTYENFGCGSSREHAVWGLVDYGIEAIIAPSFGEIFYNNAMKNGLLPIVLDESIVMSLIEQSDKAIPFQLDIDLQLSHVKAPDGQLYPFKLSEDDRVRLMEGLDDIALTLQDAQAIKSYEAARQQMEPWLFGMIKI